MSEEGRAAGRSVASWLPFLLASGLLLIAVERWGGFRAEATGRALSRALVEEGDPRPVLLFAFHADDCPDFGRLLEQWEALERSGEARVVGVMLGRRSLMTEGEPPELGFALRPELARATERLVVGLGHRRTPVALLLDPEGRVRVALAARPEAAAQAEAARQVREYLGWLRREG